MMLKTNSYTTFHFDPFWTSLESKLGIDWPPHSYHCQVAYLVWTTDMDTVSY